MEFEELLKHKGETITLLGEQFKICYDEMCGTIYLGKLGEEFVMYATLNYDMRGIPFEVDDGIDNFFHAYEGEVKDFEDYVKKVEQMYEMYYTEKEMLSRNQEKGVGNLSPAHPSCSNKKKCAFCNKNEATESITDSETMKEVMICVECDKQMGWEDE